MADEENEDMDLADGNEEEEEVEEENEEEEVEMNEEENEDDGGEEEDEDGENEEEDDNNDHVEQQLQKKSSKVEDIIITSEEIEKVTKELIEAKVELAILKKRKKLLLEEVHRQCLEGELDPKKRLKPYYDKRKKMKIAQDNILPLEKA